jgi:hypothetical protein
MSDPEQADEDLIMADNIKDFPTGGLVELPTFTWIFKSGSHAYLYSGPKSGLSDALSKVKKNRWTQGSSVSVHLVVK